MRIGFIGLGIMGSRMARNVLRGGHALSVYNRSPGKSDLLAREGAIVAASAAEAGKGAAILFTMLSHPDAVAGTAIGKNGFLDVMTKGSLWVDCSTVNPSFSRQMAAEAARRGIRFVDAPVTGSLPFAEKGELTFLVGAETKDLEECTPLLRLMGKTIKHMGGTGMGASMKMIINMMLGTAMAAFSEALAFGEALGFSRKALLDMLVGGAVAGPFIAGKRSNLESAHLQPGVSAALAAQGPPACLRHRLRERRPHADDQCGERGFRAGLRRRAQGPGFLGRVGALRQEGLTVAALFDTGRSRR